MTLLGSICTQYPDAQLAIIFLPFFTFSAKTVGIYLSLKKQKKLFILLKALLSLLSFDLFGTIMKWRYLDHSAHLGGVLFGM